MEMFCHDRLIDYMSGGGVKHNERPEKNMSQL